MHLVLGKHVGICLSILYEMIVMKDESNQLLGYLLVMEGKFRPRYNTVSI